MNKYNNEIEEN